ncbi:hypothetical protein EYF80_023679 [Liparis tanakae]|uniref:Uncharacterized protein n=1 Tax=Liparis tanakae TaxID=230148 RepID=A0A4Z2HKD6_9TELE|nr:hypothetical protein EYF80_023679 [Liparis tanakae]
MDHHDDTTILSEPNLYEPSPCNPAPLLPLLCAAVKDKPSVCSAGLSPNVPPLVAANGRNSEQQDESLGRGWVVRQFRVRSLSKCSSQCAVQAVG